VSYTCPGSQYCLLDVDGRPSCLDDCSTGQPACPTDSTCEPAFNRDGGIVSACVPADGATCAQWLAGQASTSGGSSSGGSTSSGGSSSGGSGACAPAGSPGTVTLCGACCSDTDCAANEYCVVGTGSNYCSYNCEAAPSSACGQYGCAGGVSGVKTVDGGTIGGACTCQ
jgi:hypothetical protein